MWRGRARRVNEASKRPSFFSSPNFPESQRRQERSCTQAKALLRAEAQEAARQRPCLAGWGAGATWNRVENQASVPCTQTGQNRSRGLVKSQAQRPGHPLAGGKRREPPPRAPRLDALALTSSGAPRPGSGRVREEGPSRPWTHGGSRVQAEKAERVLGMEWERVGGRGKDLERDRNYTKKRRQKNEGGWEWEADRQTDTRGRAWKPQS